MKLSDSEKEPFMEMARKDKERYLKNIFNTDCYVKENINKNLSKINIERCIN